MGHSLIYKFTVSLFFMHSDCYIVGVTVPVISTTTPPPPTTTPTQPPMAFACNFDNSRACNFYQDGDIRWSRLNVPTWSSQTGPDADHTHGNLMGKLEIGPYSDSCHRLWSETQMDFSEEKYTSFRDMTTMR